MSVNDVSMIKVLLIPLTFDHQTIYKPFMFTIIHEYNIDL